MAEHIVLVFKDGTRYDVDSGSLRSLAGALKAQRKRGDPVEVIGEGTAARRLREQYRLYNVDRENYRSDVVGSISMVAGMSRQEAQEKFDAVKSRVKKWVH